MTLSCYKLTYCTHSQGKKNRTPRIQKNIETLKNTPKVLTFKLKISECTQTKKTKMYSFVLQNELNKTIQ